jgi:hypothetical protein
VETGLEDRHKMGMHVPPVAVTLAPVDKNGSGQAMNFRSRAAVITRTGGPVMQSVPEPARAEE